MVRRRCGDGIAPKIDRLAQRLPTIGNAEIDKVSRIYWLIEDCKRYGTLPFAGLARAGFIAVQMLQSFVGVGVLTTDETAAFMASVDTVGLRIGEDFARLSKADFLARYGHLRPGTCMTFCLHATTRIPISILTGRPPGQKHRHHQDSPSRSISCATLSGC